MKLSPLGRVVIAGGLAFVFPASALAHSGDPGSASWSCGVAHPLHGWDHLLAAVAIGGWAALHRGCGARLIGMAFISAVACGAAFGPHGALAPGIDLIVLGSVILVGICLAQGAMLRTGVSAALVTAFALCHGLAHAAEAPLFADSLAYVAGLVTTTATLVTVGYVAGRALLRVSPWLPRLAGALCASVGLGLLLS